METLLDGKRIGAEKNLRQMYLTDDCINNQKLWDQVWVNTYYSTTVTDVIDDTPVLLIFNIADKNMFPWLVSKANWISESLINYLHNFGSAAA